MTQNKVKKELLSLFNIMWHSLRVETNIKNKAFSKILESRCGVTAKRIGNVIIKHNYETRTM